MIQAELSGRDFAADRGQAKVVNSMDDDIGCDSAKAQNRKQAEESNQHKLKIPRRPQWTRDLTAEQLDAQEKASFLQWRKSLAELEHDERLVLTPFEKNLNVWRQLWRVLERSDIVVQVVDARDPLRYWNEDLTGYCLELKPKKHSVLLMNKSDMVPPSLRKVWADYFEENHIDYIFWSAKIAATELDDLHEKQIREDPDPRISLKNIEGLINALRSRAFHHSDPVQRQHRKPSEHVVVGLVGYPNVGKSSTINALFGSKKTAVAATPGKTKHFQTLFVSDDLCLCDCPGLVMPQFARSKAEMVAAGVVPIDRLTDIFAPVEVIATRVPMGQFEEAYGIKLSNVPSIRDSDGPARKLLDALASSRGWVQAGGQPDHSRAGRRVLKDYMDGKILFCVGPPGKHQETDHQKQKILSQNTDYEDISYDIVRNSVASLDTEEQEGTGRILGDEIAIEMDANIRYKSRPSYKFKKKAQRSKNRHMVS